MSSQVAVDVSSRFRFICNRNLLYVHAPHLSAFQALDLPKTTPGDNWFKVQMPSYVDLNLPRYVQCALLKYLGSVGASF